MEDNVTENEQSDTYTLFAMSEKIIKTAPMMVTVQANSADLVMEVDTGLPYP